MPIAIDIVLEVPRAIGDEAIALNRELDEQPNRIQLGYEAAIPHISLAMGVIENASLEELKAMLDEEFGDQELFSCMVGPLFQHNNINGEWMAGISLDRCDSILYMHENAVSVLEEAGFVMPTLGALHDYQNADPGTLDIISSFREKYSFENYQPHITIGYGSLPGLAHFEPRLVEFNHIGLYHLGNHATARRKIHDVRLRQPNEVAQGGF